MKRAVDNFELLAKTLFPNGKEAAEGEFYFVQVLVRGKDGNNVNGNNKNRLVRYYVVRSAEKLLEIKPEVELLCTMHNARAYIHPTPRSDKDVAAIMLQQAVKEFTEGNYHMFRRLYSTAAGQSFVTDKKIFIVDLDPEQLNAETDGKCTALDAIKMALIICRGKAGEGNEKVIAEVPTKSGLHLLCTPFDVGQFERLLGSVQPYGIPAPDVHKNNPTVLFCWKEDDQ